MTGQPITTQTHRVVLGATTRQWLHELVFAVVLLTGNHAMGTSTSQRLEARIEHLTLVLCEMSVKQAPPGSLSFATCVQDMRFSPAAEPAPQAMAGARR
jgi:hypothetical protein